MKNFFRAVRLAFHHRLTIVGILISSSVVAMLWGVNIGTVKLFVEVVFEGQSMRQWIDGEIADGRATVNRLNEQLAAFDSPDQRRSGGASRSLASIRSRLAAEERALAWSNRLRPYIYRWMPSEPFHTLVFVVIFLLIGTTLKVAFLMLNLILVERITQLSIFDLRKHFYRRTLQMDLGAFGDNRTSGLLSRFTHDMGAVSTGLNTLFGRTLLEPLKMLACLIGAAWICWRLLLLSLLVALPAVLVIRRLSQSIKRANRRSMEEMSVLYSVLSETFAGIQAVKAFTMERFERSRFHQTGKAVFHKSMRIALYGALTRPTTEFMGIGVVCLAVLAGGYLVMYDKTTLLGVPITVRPLDRGSLLAFFALLVGVSDPARKLADVFTTLQRAAAASDRIFQLLDREPCVAEPAQPRELPHPHRELVLDGVHFHYSPGHPVLTDVNLRIAFGETLAIVGPNGCGKTTLASLIPRFYDPVQGSVRLDDVDLREARLRDLRGRIGLVTQQTLLFDDTIMNNIRYGSSGATNDQVIEAAKKARADHFIEEQLANGYATIVGERGGNLSGGQRQRIALARAILRNPEILILDEATSQVDLESEQLIHAALKQFVRGRTTILITHRLSTLQLASRILVMDEGRVLDVGSHSELIARCGLYQRLYQIGFRESA